MTCPTDQALITMITGRDSSLIRMLPTILGERGSSDVSEIQAVLTQRGKRCSVQAIYKVLRKLESEGVVIRGAGRYELSLYWILELSEFVSNASRSYFSKPTHQVTVEEGEKRVWILTDIRQLDNLWMQILTALSTKSENKNIYSWVPFPWFDLIQPRNVLRFRKQLARERVRVHHTLMAGSKLNESIASAWSPPLHLIRFERAAPSQLRLYYQCIDNYLLTIKMDRHSSELIRELFRKSTSASQLDLPTFNQLLVTKVRAVVTLECGTKNADKMRAVLSKGFN